ncbi:unnamed protein product [Tuber melanosporum]|uniref:(Perigord truffle) hypothetical protein n=1 Tax=Tuber melanosporum (strain Mel28) TaxID=656061 RepID=D5GPT1_TUBMM|nr:uncharacterized protein GSTUM_00012017001 [Tuber melanosporum]CAZ86524.1 unnamed protein product [Tuber melanosporum]
MPYGSSCWKYVISSNDESYLCDFLGMEMGCHVREYGYIRPNVFTPVTMYLVYLVNASVEIHLYSTSILSLYHSVLSCFQPKLGVG